MSFFSSAARQVAPGILLICALMPMAASASCISTAIGSPTVAPPRSKLSVVSKPLAHAGLGHQRLGLGDVGACSAVGCGQAMLFTGLLPP